MKSQVIFAVVLALPLVLSGCLSIPQIPIRTSWDCQPLNQAGAKMPQKKARLICSGERAKHQKLDKSKTCTTNIYEGALGLSGTQRCADSSLDSIVEGAEKDNVFLACMAEKDWECTPLYSVYDEATGKMVDYPLE